MRTVFTVAYLWLAGNETMKQCNRSWKVEFRDEGSGMEKKTETTISLRICRNYLKDPFLHC